MGTKRTRRNQTTLSERALSLHFSSALQLESGEINQSIKFKRRTDQKKGTEQNRASLVLDEILKHVTLRATNETRTGRREYENTTTNKLRNDYRGHFHLLRMFLNG
jgi:hypothetical protein